VSKRVVVLTVRRGTETRIWWNAGCRCTHVHCSEL